jgi:ferredoxin
MIRVILIDAQNNRTTYELNESPSIITAFEDAGYTYPHGCQVGVCGSCLSEVTEGIENLPPRDFIEQRRLEELQAEERRQGSRDLDATHLRFCCRTALTGPVTLRPLSGTVRKKK